MKSNLSVMSLWVVLLPLLVAIINGLLNKKISRTLAANLGIGALGISFILSCLVLGSVIVEDIQPFQYPLYSWANVGNVSFQVGFLIDRLTAFMMVVVTFVSWMVHIYSKGYMDEDPGFQRFFSYISAFTFAMLMLVMSNNFLQLFFGWEGVGLMSYLLIGFWFEKESANRASLKAFLLNRVGDMGFLMGIAAVVFYFSSVNYTEVFEILDKSDIHKTSLSFFNHETASVNIITFITLCLFIGAMGKSAQIPLHVWLPDSMEGPTPISALIHAATMVTAGVFMVARLSPLFEYSDVSLNVILIIGALTALLTGILGIVQNDIKRIIAYSTLSQLGYMMVAMGASSYAIGIFHLMTHAFYKALLFLGAGSVIHALHHEQNIWKMGQLRKYMPITYGTMLIGSLALVGFPGFSGFYSKDLIIEAVKNSTLFSSGFAYGAVLISVLITAIYTFRLFFVVFHGFDRVDHKLQPIHESPKTITLPLVILAIPSIIMGAIFVEPLFSNFFGTLLSNHENHPSFEILSKEFDGWWSMLQHGFFSLPSVFGLVGFLIAWTCYIRYPYLPHAIQTRFHLLYSVLKVKYGFDFFYEVWVVKSARILGALFWRGGDGALIDGIGVDGTAKRVGKAATLFRHLQTGYLYHYAFAMIIGFLVLTVWLLVFKARV